MEEGAVQASGGLEAEEIEEAVPAKFLEVLNAFGGGGEFILAVLEAGPVLGGDVKEVLEFEFEVGRNGVVPVDDGIQVAAADAEGLGGLDLGDAAFIQKIAKGFAGLSRGNRSHGNTLLNQLMLTIMTGRDDFYQEQCHKRNAVFWIITV